MTAHAWFAVAKRRLEHVVVELRKSVERVKGVDGCGCAVRWQGDSGRSIIRVPGAWELPVAVKKILEKRDYDAVIALGAVIRGGTAHFEYVAGEAAKGIAAVQNDTGVPVAFGVLTVESIEQAIERSGTKAGNKGAEAAMSALEMVSLFKAL